MKPINLIKSIKDCSSLWINILWDFQKALWQDLFLRKCIKSFWKLCNHIEIWHVWQNTQYDKLRNVLCNWDTQRTLNSGVFKHCDTIYFEKIHCGKKRPVANSHKTTGNALWIQFIATNTAKTLQVLLPGPKRLSKDKNYSMSYSSAFFQTKHLVFSSSKNCWAGKSNLECSDVLLL